MTLIAKRRFVVGLWRFASIQPRIVSARRAKPREAKFTRERCARREEYDFSKARKNPYPSQLKKQTTIRLHGASITYFKSISEDVGSPYQSLINLYLCECAMSKRKLDLDWRCNDAREAGGRNIGFRDDIMTSTADR